MESQIELKLKKNIQKKTYDKTKILFVLKKIFKNEFSSKNLLQNVDSVRFIEILIQIERKFNIKIDDSDISPKNFKNLETLSDLIIKSLK